MLDRPTIVFIWYLELFFDLGPHILLSVTAVFAPILPQQKLTRKVRIFRIEPANFCLTNDNSERPRLVTFTDLNLYNHVI